MPTWWINRREKLVD